MDCLLLKKKEEMIELFKNNFGILYLKKYDMLGFRQCLTSGDYWQRIKYLLHECCNWKTLLKIGFTLLILAIVFYVFIGRTGHSWQIPVPEFELNMRYWLEEHMYARPREKEFLIGHIAFFFLVLGYHKNWPRFVCLILAVVAAIGQVSLVETFCHMRSPFAMSVARALGGYVFGMALGATLVWAFVKLGEMKNAKEGQYDLVLMDLMLPGISGEWLIKGLREYSKVPVIVISAKSMVETRIEMLRVGADDYITKPFNPLELVARVKSNIRRYTTLGSINVADDNKYAVGDLVIDDDTKEVIVEGNQVKLTPIEYNILLLLVKNQGRVFSIDQIYENIWEEEAIGADNTVAVHIRHIREKIEINPKEPKYLKVVWGVGYKIEKQ